MKANDKAIEALADVLQHHGVFHGWFPKGLPSDWRQLDPIGRREFLDIAGRLADAAYAAQFQSEDYAGLITELRMGWATREKNNRAADALEAVLAERDELDKWLRESKQNFMRVDIERNNLRAERDALLARFTTESALRGQLLQQQSAIGPDARLAPEDDEALVEIVADAIDTPLPSLTWEEREGGARAAIAAIRPHIEAVERKRCAAALEITSDEIRLHAGEMTAQEMRSVLSVLTWRAAAIRSGK